MADDPIGEKRFSGDLITVLREMQAFIAFPAQSHPVEDSALRERMVTDYPAVAIRELLLNAIMHRSYETNAPVRFYWYEDRIEIQKGVALLHRRFSGHFAGVSPRSSPVRRHFRGGQRQATPAHTPVRVTCRAGSHRTVVCLLRPLPLDIRAAF